MLNKTLLLITLLGTTSLFASDYSLSVSADTTRFDYAETNSAGQLLDTENADFGKIFGATLSIEPQYQGLYFTAAYAKGDTNYIGGTNLNPTFGSHLTTTTNEISNYDFGYKATARNFRSDLEMPVIIGVGYHQWLRQLHSTPGVSGFDERYDWEYYNVGIGLHYRMSSTMSIGTDASYRKAFNAKMYENLHGYTFNLNNVYGYKITVPFEVKLNPQLSTFIAYNYEYWNVDASNVVGGYYEPDSQTKNEILSFGLKFYF